MDALPLLLNHAADIILILGALWAAYLDHDRGYGSAALLLAAAYKGLELWRSLTERDRCPEGYRPRDRDDDGRRQRSPEPRRYVRTQ